MRDPGKAGWLLPPDPSLLRDGDVQSGSLAFLPPRGARGVTVVEVLLMPWGSPGFKPCPCPLAVGFARWLRLVLSEPNSQPGQDAGPCTVQMVETPLNEMLRDGRGVPAKQSS